MLCHCYINYINVTLSLWQSPWNNHHGWQGVKKQVPSLWILHQLVIPPPPPTSVQQQNQTTQATFSLNFIWVLLNNGPLFWVRQWRVIRIYSKYVPLFFLSRPLFLNLFFVGVCFVSGCMFRLLLQRSYGKPAGWKTHVHDRDRQGKLEWYSWNKTGFPP